MDYQTVTVWMLAGMILVIVSCVKYKEFIITAFSNNTWAWVNAMMPVLIMVFGIGYMLKSIFR